MFWSLIQKPDIIFFKGILLLIQSIGLEKGNKKDEFFFGDFIISCYIFYSTNKGIL